MSRLAERLKRLEVIHGGGIEGIDRLRTEEQMAAWATTLSTPDLDRAIVEVERRLAEHAENTRALRVEGKT